MSRYQLYLVADATDSIGKTTAIMVRRIRVLDGNIWYVFPEELQKISNHSQLAALASVKSAISVLKTRGQFRNVNITLPTEVEKLYVDTDGNFIFNGFFLSESRSNTSSAVSSDPAISELVTSLTKLTAEKDESVKEILKHFLVEKFSPKNRNVEAWCKSFEKECVRFALSGPRQIEVFKSCLDLSLADWFAINQKKLSLDADWSIWKSDLVSTFGDVSWKPIRYAYTFKYLNGSYIEYALKKEKMLLDLDRNLSDVVILDLIVVGLPFHVQNSLNRNSVTSLKILHSKLKKFEADDKIFDSSNRSGGYNSSPPSTKRNFDFSNKKGRIFNNSNSERKDFESERKPYSTCSKRGFPNRSHPELNGWFKNKESLTPKAVNNVELNPASLSFSQDQKNE